MSKPDFTQHLNTAWLQPLALAMPDSVLLALNRRAHCLLMNHTAQHTLGLTQNQRGRYDLSPTMRKALVDTIKQEKNSVTITTNLNGLKRSFVCRIIYPTQKRRALGLLMEEVALTMNDQLKRMHGVVQSLISLSSDLICIKDADNRWMMANQSLLDTFQINPHDYQFQNNLQIAAQIHPIFTNSFVHHEKSDKQAWKNTEMYRHEEVVFLPEGGTKTLEVSKLASFDENEHPSHLIMVAKDVTQQKQNERLLEQKSAVLDALIASDCILHSADRWQNVAETVLQHCCISFRFSRAMLLQHYVSHGRKKTDMRSRALYHWSVNGFHATYQHWEKLPLLSPQLQRWHGLLSKGQPVICDVSVLPDNERRLIKSHDALDIVIVPLMIGGAWWGSLVIERCFESSPTNAQELGSLMAIGRTLSVAIDREQTGRHLNLAKIAFDSTTEGIMIVNPEGELIGLNHGYSLITGYDEGELLGTKPQVFRQKPAGFWAALRRHGKWSGEIENHRKNGEKYTEWMTITAVRSQTNQLTNYVGVIADITQIKESQSQLNTLVNHDPLTGLPNRRLINHLFKLSIQRASRNRQQTAVLFIDLDRFKNINDSLGHFAGDQLLLAVSERLRASVRESDIVGRLGGDEFIVLLDNVHDKNDVANKAQLVLDALKREFVIESHEIFAGASIGISMYPQDGADVDHLLKAADLAMYQVKNNGKNDYAFYCTSLSQHAVEHFQLEHELRYALAKQQLRLVFQPQIDLETGLIVGAEALIRWQHPELGLISPAKFIPLAEETGLILGIGEWALAQAVKQANQWNRLYPEFKKIAVNVSGVQIMKSQFADTVYGILLENDGDASMLEVEITESTLMQHTEHVINTFNRLKQLGVTIAIDDFGTGYSSLSHLKSFPLDQLKIDRSFVKDLPNDKDDAAITNAIYAMATQLGFTVVAEGVETEAQEQFLKKLGCQSAQGFLYSYPIPAEAFAQLLVINNQKTFKRHA